MIAFVSKTHRIAWGRAGAIARRVDVIDVDNDATRAEIDDIDIEDD